MPRISGHLLEGRQSSRCGQAGRATLRPPVPGRLVLVNPASQFSALRYLALAGTGQASRRGPGSMIGRSIIWHSATAAADGYAASPSGPWPAAALACGASACTPGGQKVQPWADSAGQCRLAHCPHRYSSPARSTRYAAPVAGPHRSQVSFISGHLPVRRRAQVPGPPSRMDCSPRSVCCPGPAASQPSGATARSGAGSRGAGRGRRASADGRRPCGAPGAMVGM